MSAYVAFTGSDRTVIMAVFANEQDLEVYPYQDVVEDDDPRYLLFLNPPPNYLAISRAERDRLVAYAALKIDPLQDAVDIDEATPDDVIMLKAWKKYRSDLGKLETKPGWPQSPAWPVPPIPLESVQSAPIEQEE